MINTNWKESEKYGSFYRIENNTLYQRPALKGGGMDVMGGSSVYVDQDAFTQEEVEPFIIEMVAIFNPDYGNNKEEVREIVTNQIF